MSKRQILNSCLPLAGMMAASMGTSALAQTAESIETSDVLLLDPIIMQSRDEYGNAADRGTSVYVADAELERARMGDLKDLFAGLANVSVGGAIPVAQKIFVNGVDMLNLAVTVDGVSQNNRIFHHASANAFDPGLMKFVRVDPGVAPADAGPFALAGRVVMETVDAADILDEGDDFGGNVRLSYGDNGKTWQASTTLAGRSGGFEYLGYLKRATGEDYEAGDNGGVMTGTGANLTAGLLKLAYETQSGARFELSAQQMNDTELRNMRANFGPNGVLYVYDTERSVYSASYEANAGTGFWDPTVSIGYSETIVDVDNGYDSQGTANTFSAKFQNEFHLGGENAIVAGVDFQDRKGHYVGTGEGPFWESIQNLGLFVQARFDPTDRLSVSGGLRYDWEDFAGETASGVPFSDSYSGASGNLSLVYDLTDQLSLRAGYSSIFGGVQIEDNYLYWQSFDYASLRSAKSRNWVVGADWDNGALAMGAEVFRSEIDNVREGGSNYDFAAKGFNLYGTYGWGSGFARLTFSRSDATRDGIPMSSYNLLDSGAPLGDVLAFEIQQEISSLDMIVGGSLEAAFDYDSGASEYASIGEIPGYEVVNLFAEWSPKATSLPGLTIRAEVRNLFDVDYADRATYGGDYTGFATLKEPGRTFAITLVSEF